MAREKRITVRLTEKEYEELEKRRGSIPKSEFLYYILLNYLGEEQELDKRLKQIEKECQHRCEFCRKVYTEIGKIGSNVNQIARALNKKKLPAKERRVLLNLVLETIEFIQELKMRLLEDGDIEKDS